MAHPLPAPRPCLSHHPHRQYWAASASSHPSDMQITAAFNDGSFRADSDKTLMQFDAHGTTQSHVPGGNGPVCAMQQSTHEQSCETVADDGTGAAWVFQQHHHHQHHQQQQQQQQHQHSPQHQSPNRHHGAQFIPNPSLDPSRSHQFTTTQTPASVIAMQQQQQQQQHRQQMQFMPMAEQHPNAAQMRPRAAMFQDGQDAHSMYQLELMQYAMNQAQPVVDPMAVGQGYQMDTAIPSGLILSPQSYSQSLDSNYSNSGPSEGSMQDFLYYSQDEQSPPHARAFAPMAFDIVPSAAMLQGGDLSPSSTMSSSVVGDAFAAHTPDSLMSFTNTFEGAAISGNGVAMHTHSGSYASQHSGMSVSSASPHDIWQQPSSSPEADTCDDADDVVALGMPVSCSPYDEDAFSHHTSRGNSSESTPWPVSPETTRQTTVVNNNNNNNNTASSSTSQNRKSTGQTITIGKVSQKAISKKPSVKKNGQVVRVLAEKLDTKRTGRRKGPLTSDQRRQAGEIRKLKACLRCKFLKKMCDPNGPCAGCRPSHARLWMVPCTRLDIRELHYFMDEWKVDYERHVTKGITVSNIIDYAPGEQQIFIGHGFGDFISISAREVYVRDEGIFKVDWVETIGEKPDTYEHPTSSLVIGRAGLSTKLLNDYLDCHIDKSFNVFVQEMFEGTEVWTELLLTVHTLYQKTHMPELRNALKFFITYNLTQHVTYQENADEDAIGTIGDVGSKHTGKTLAPVLLNYEIKVALANIWRECHKKLLSDLSTLFSSVYSAKKLRNWALIMLLSSILLMVWEEMQFDSYYRMEQPDNALKFCNEMESVPVGVITGLFSAISQKIPALRDWDSEQHRSIFRGIEHEKELCEAVEKTRDAMLRHESYLRKRDKAQYDEQDFDSLCNKFVHRILLRPT